MLCFGEGVGVLSWEEFDPWGVCDFVEEDEVGSRTGGFDCVLGVLGVGGGAE